MLDNRKIYEQFTRQVVACESGFVKIHRQVFFKWRGVEYENTTMKYDVQRLQEHENFSKPRHDFSEILLYFFLFFASFLLLV